ncbi:CTP--2,3-di-O-geranylgeranyl-sn-glycero-1-phosphate cytidyltransferase [Candidatus Pacearchaeota archaeon]|nr:CTP--2,3-di-O-geranylgeranyl-sn-glycero-1-phosphate cytidyltransferase [Candidatus Pacearchaeota archaeon]
MKASIKRGLRKSFIHIATLPLILIYALLTNNFGKDIALYFLTFLLIVILELDYFRIELKLKIPILKDLVRAKEKRDLGGDFFFLIGAIISLTVFSFPIAIASIAMLTFGRSASHIIGKRFGQIKIKRFGKSFEGLLAELFINLLVGFFLLMPVFPLLNSILITILMAFTATLTEMVTKRLDDNLLIPVFSGFNGQILALALPYLFSII